MLGKCEIMTRKLSTELAFLNLLSYSFCTLNCMQVMHKFIPLYVRQYDSAAILIVYLPISENWTILDMLKHAVRYFAQGAIEG